MKRLPAVFHRPNYTKVVEPVVEPVEPVAVPVVEPVPVEPIQKEKQEPRRSKRVRINAIKRN